MKIRSIGMLVSGFIMASYVFFAAVASAHVTVKPGEALTGSFQVFNVSVPNEKTIPSVSVKLLIPENIRYVTPTAKDGWKIDIEKDGTGEDAVVKSIIWSDSTIEEGFRNDFSFSAQVPDQATDIQWKAYQTYSDGTVVAWDKVSEGDGHNSGDTNSGPFSVTKVIAEPTAASDIKQLQSTVNDVKTTSDRAFYAAIAGIVLGLLATAIAIIRTR